MDATDTNTNTNTNTNEKPPLGLIPHFVRVEQRTLEILEAMHRYASVGYEVPLVWRKELDDLLDEPHWKRVGDGHDER